MQGKGGESVHRGRLCARSGSMTNDQRSMRQKGGRPKNLSRYGWHPGSLRLRRYALGITAGELAELVAEETGGKVSRGAVGTWERGEVVPESRSVEAIAAVLGCEPWELGREPAVVPAVPVEEEREEEPRGKGGRSRGRAAEGVGTRGGGDEPIDNPHDIARPHF